MASLTYLPFAPAIPCYANSFHPTNSIILLIFALSGFENMQSPLPGRMSMQFYSVSRMTYLVSMLVLLPGVVRRLRFS